MPPPQGSWNPIEGPGDYTTTRTVHSDTYAAISPLAADLHGKAVFVSGASKGIGRAIAVAFAQAGASFLALAARSDLSDMIAEVRAAARNGADGVKVLGLKMDVADERSVREGVRRVEEEAGGRLDVVVNNAGVLAGRGKVGGEEGDGDGWWQNFDVNVRGPYLVSKACMPLLLKGELKVLITVGSVGAHCVSAGLSGYQISKLAAVRLMEFVAAEYADSGIVAVSVHPGNILTEIVGHGEGMDPKLKAVFTETPQLCAHSLVYLAKENRPWLSGRYINCTWDLPELLSDPKKEEIIKGDLLKVRLAV